MARGKLFKDFHYSISHESLETSNDSDQFSSNALFQED